MALYGRKTHRYRRLVHHHIHRRGGPNIQTVLLDLERVEDWKREKIRETG